MDEHEHHVVASWERRWLAVAAIMSITFVILIAFNLAMEGAHIAQLDSKAPPAELLATNLFAEPGVRQLAPGRFQVTVVSHTFAFQPRVVRLPVGAEAEFYLTSRDVIHGYQVEDTNINIEVIPGEISTFRYRFDRPGEYRVTCNEYCGIGHHTMLGTVQVVPAAQYAQPERPEPPAAEDVDGLPLVGVGAQVYDDVCASCHQPNGEGIAGVFPPLAGHAPHLIEDYGRNYLPYVVLFGMEGPIDVDGRRYDGVMPPWQNLSNEQVAGAINYIVSAWGNQDALPEDFQPYTPDDIATARQAELAPDDVHDIRTGEGQ